MSQANHRDIELGDDTVLPDGHRDHDQSQAESPENRHSQLSQEESNRVDSSWPLYAIYSKIAQEEDNKMAERCQKGADGVLIFSGLFLATVATIMSVTIQDLRSDPSGFYLQNIYQVLAKPNASAPILAYPPAFSPPLYALWVNSLFLLSAIFSLASALAAILRQEWAFRYIVVTQQPWHTPDQQARIRAFFAHSTRGPDILPGSTGASYFYLPISICCFVVGGLIYVYQITRIGFTLLVLLAMVGAINYARITIGAIFQHDKLYYSALTPLALRLYLCISFVWSRIHSNMTPRDDATENYENLKECYNEGFLIGKQKRAQKIISEEPSKSSEIDADVLDWTLQCIGEDDALKSFLEAIPGFFESKLVKNLELNLSKFRPRLYHALDGFLDRIFSSDSVSEIDRSHRLIICLNAARAALSEDDVSRILDKVLNECRHGALQSVEVGHSLRRWNDEQFSSHLRRILAHLISHVRERNNRWVALVKDEFGIQDRVLKDCIAHGDSVSLAILIHVTRQFFHSNFSSQDPEILHALSNFDVCNTLPGLQQEFCALWDEIVQESRKAGAHPTTTTTPWVLRGTRHVYTALHHSTVVSPEMYSGLTVEDGNTLLEPLSYPLCDITAHHPGSAASAPLDPTPSIILSQGQPRQPTENIINMTPHVTDIPAPSLSSPSIPAAPITVVSDIAVNASSDNLLPSFPSSDGRPRQLNAEISSTSPPSLSSSSLFPSQTPILSSNTIPTVPSPTLNDVVTPSSYHDTLVSPSSAPSLTSPAPHVVLSVISGLDDPHAPTSVEVLDAYEDTRGLSPPTLMEVQVEVSSRSHRPVLSTPDTSIVPRWSRFLAHRLCDTFRYNETPVITFTSPLEPGTLHQLLISSQLALYWSLCT